MPVFKFSPGGGISEGIIFREGYLILMDSSLWCMPRIMILGFSIKHIFPIFHPLSRQSLPLPSLPRLSRSLTDYGSPPTILEYF